MHLKTFFDRYPLTFFVLLSVVAFLPGLFIPYLHIDEGNWAAMSRVIFSGEFYDRWSDNKPPFLMQWFWLLSLGGHSMFSLHLGSALWWAIGAEALRRSLLNFFSAELSLLGGSLMVLLGGTLNYGAFSAELALTPFLLWATRLSISQSIFRHEMRPYRQWPSALMVGVLIALACNIKPTAILLGIWAGLFFFIPPAFFSFDLILKSLVRFFAMAWVALLGGVLVTFVLWQMVGTSFANIFHEAIEINLHYVRFDNLQSSQAIKDVFSNIGVVLGVAYLSVSLGSLLALRVFFQRLRSDFIKRVRSVFGLFMIAALILALFKTISMGERYFQQYFVAILPGLIFFTVYACRYYPKFKRTVMGFSIISLIIFQSKIFYLQLTDQNKNWNSDIQATIQRINGDLNDEDSLWVTNALGMIYHQTKTQPPVKYYYFLHLIKFVEICRADASELREDHGDAIYHHAVESLRTNPPKVIFWATGHEHSCSDRIRAENFESLREILDTRYEHIESTKLGDYYRRKDLSQ